MPSLWLTFPISAAATPTRKAAGLGERLRGLKQARTPLAQQQTRRAALSLGRSSRSPARTVTMASGQERASIEPFPIGTPGQPWGDAERAAWLDSRTVKRSYRDEVREPPGGNPPSSPSFNGPACSSNPSVTSLPEGHYFAVLPTCLPPPSPRVPSLRQVCALCHHSWIPRPHARMRQPPAPPTQP